MKLRHIIGADISKNSIDLFCHGVQSHLKITNDVAGLKQLRLWLKQLKLSFSNLVFVMEHTGYYSYLFENFLYQNRIGFSKVSALAIKKSLGMVRGKNDKIDAKRIARYGYEKCDKLRLEGAPDKLLQRLQMLHSSRDLLVRQRSALMCALKEYSVVIDQDDPIIQSHIKLIDELTKQIKSYEQEMRQILNQPGSVAQNFKLLTSVKGIGPVVATATLIKTRNFTRFTNRKKFSCYCGSAPFDHSSGKSIRKKTRISHLADKTMKTLLTQSAKTAIQHDKDLRQYYQRRIQMGKSKRSTINIVRNKIIYRMFAVIRRQSPFVEQNLKSA